MAEEKKQQRWAPTVVEEPSEEQLEMTKFDAERQARLDSAVLAVPYFLDLIYKELKRANDLYEKTPIRVDEPAPEFVSEEAPVVPRPPPVIPANLESEGDIEKYYKDVLSQVLEEDRLAQVEITVEEDAVRLKTGWIGDKALWRQLHEFLTQTIGGQYVSAGRDTHYVLPKP